MHAFTACCCHSRAPNSVALLHTVQCGPCSSCTNNVPTPTLHCIAVPLPLPLQVPVVVTEQERVVGTHEHHHAHQTSPLSALVRRCAARRPSLRLRTALWCARGWSASWSTGQWRSRWGCCSCRQTLHECLHTYCLSQVVNRTEWRWRLSAWRACYSCVALQMCGSSGVPTGSKCQLLKAAWHEQPDLRPCLSLTVTRYHVWCCRQLIERSSSVTRSRCYTYPCFFVLCAHLPALLQYVVETKFVGEKEMGVAGAEIMDIKDRVVDVAAPGPTCPVNTGKLALH